MVKSEFDKRQITQQMQETRQDISRSLDLRDGLLIEPAADEVDEAQAAEARELAIRNLERSARTLRQIEKALHRLSTDEYGICESCEKAIGAKRLHAVPWAQFCLDCQENADQRECDDCGDYEAEPLVSAT